MNNRFATLFWSLALLLAVSSTWVQAQESGWPRTLPLAGGSVTIYPLQVDDVNGDLIRFRAALAYRQSGQTDPVFGAGWFESRVDIDQTNGVVHPIDLKVTDTRFPAGTDDVQQELTAVFAQQMPGWSLDFPLEELQASLETAEQEAKTVQALNTAPPTIIYRDHPALLVNIDGEPVLRKIENSPYQAVINTPYPLISDGNTYYLSAAKGVWYRADSAAGPYRYEASPPADIVAMVEAADKAEVDQAPSEKVTAANAPEIVVATTPSELIVTEGPAEFVPLVDDLLVLQNSTDDVFMHISTQQYYIVLAGRWYHSRSLNGPWTYRAASALPVAFTNIPADSDQADSRVYVAGTNEAKEAVLDAQIPQTAAVARGTVDIDVNYDGDPRFEPVQGTELTYADNTGSTVIQSDRWYYLVEDGVWYVSASPNGPWEVSDYRPEEVAAISPESPVYNVKYVYVYDSTPEYVYVGYTPGYVGSYVYNDTLVYGTGYYYRPWVSPYYYYPRYSTWGFNVSYNPWYGWNFGLSWGWGPFYSGFYTGGYWHNNYYWSNPHYGYWGPGGYRPRPGHHNGYAYGRGGYDRGGYGRGGHDGGGNGHGGNDRGGDGRGGHDRGGNNRGGNDRSGNGEYVSDRNGRRQDGSNRGNSEDYVRNGNLYRDRSQRARVVETGTTSRKAPGASRDVAGSSNTTRERKGNPRNRSQNGTTPVTSERNTAGTVNRNDLRAKAQKRDAGFEATRGKDLVDNNANGKRSGQVPLERSNRNGWESASTSGEVRRSRTVAQDSRRNTSEQAARRSAPGSANAQPRQATSAERGRSAVAPSPAAGRTPRSTQSGSATQQSTSPRSTRQRSGAQKSTQQASAPQQRNKQQRSTPQQTAPQISSQQRSAPPRNTRQASTSQPRSTPQRSTQRASAQQQRSAPQQSAPQQRSTPQQSAPQQRSAPQQSAPQQRASQPRSAPQQSAPQQRAPQQRNAPQQSAPQQRSGPQQSAPSGSSRQTSGSKGGSQRSSGRRGGRDKSGNS